MKRDPSSIRIVYYDPKRRDQRMRRMIEEIEKAGIRLMQADNNRLDGFSHEVPHQGLIALAAPIDIGMSFDTLMDNLAGNPLLLLLDGVTDPRNFGACLRVADAAGVSAVITPKDRSATLTAAAVKAVPVHLKPFRLCGSRIWPVRLWSSLTLEFRSSARLQKPKRLFMNSIKMALSAGYSAPKATVCVNCTRRRCSDLPRFRCWEQVESLNVSVAAGICLFGTVRQRTVG